MSKSNESAQDKRLKYYSQKEGDIFLKHDDDPKSTAVIIRGSSIAAYTNEGKVGILIKEGGDIVLQGRPTMKASGLTIVKQDIFSQITENPMSFMASTYTTPIAAYLRKMPDLGILDSIKSMFKDFLDQFAKV